MGPQKIITCKSIRETIKNVDKTQISFSYKKKHKWPINIWIHTSLVIWNTKLKPQLNSIFHSLYSLADIEIWDNIVFINFSCNWWMHKLVQPLWETIWYSKIAYRFMAWELNFFLYNILKTLAHFHW